MPIQTFNPFPRPIPDSGIGTNIKSIQRGTLNFSGTTTTTVTISNVDITKSIVIVNISPVNGGFDNSMTCNAQITASNTITFNRNSATTGAVVNWQVIEYFNVKSLQSGLKNTTLTSDTQTISAVNTNKSIVFASWDSDNANASNIILVSYVLTNSTTITFTQRNANTRNIIWYVVEFN